MTFRFISNHGTWLLAHDFHLCRAYIGRLGNASVMVVLLLRRHDVGRSVSEQRKKKGAVSMSQRV